MLGTSSSAGDDLSPENALKLATFHLEGARKTTDPDLALLLYKEAEMVLTRMERSTTDSLPGTDCDQDHSVYEGISYIISELDKMSTSSCSRDKLQAICKKVKDLRNLYSSSSENATTVDQHRDITTLALHIFAENKKPPVIRFKLPEPDERLRDTAQLTYCLCLLKAWSLSPDDPQESTVLDWLRAIEKDEDEKERLKSLAMNVIKEFTRTDLKDANAVAEV
ncbi:hypothetical protein BGZ65_011298, partial [Modicella reniformis]